MAYINNTKLAELGCPINGAHISNFVQKVTNRFDFYKKRIINTRLYESYSVICLTAKR